MATRSRAAAAVLTMSLGMGGLLAAPAYAAGSGNGFTCTRAGACDQEYDATGNTAQFVVPQGVTSLDVELGGGSGGGSPISAGGQGGDLDARVPVMPGDTLVIVAGGAGVSGITGSETGTTAGAPGGYGGGGAAGAGSSQISFGGGGGGGGSFLIDATSSTLLAVAGGGGGGGGGGLPSAGGNGGAAGPDQAGTAGVSLPNNGAPTGGGPGTGTGPGAGGGPVSGAGHTGSPGTGPGTFSSPGVGGDGAANPFTTRETSGGGGGGYYGGGGGGSNNLGSYTSGGGGGSGYLAPSAVLTGTDTNEGDGYLEIGYHKAATRTVLHAAPVAPGHPATLTASVTAGGAPVEGTTVVFTTSTGKTLGTATVHHGVATLKVTLPSGTTTVKATSNGDDGYLASTSPAIRVVTGTHSSPAAADWYVDPLSKAQRSHLTPIPAHPDRVHGKQRFTKAIYRTHNGRLAVPAAKARSHQLHRHQAVQISTLFTFNQGTLDRHARHVLARLARSMKSVHAITCEGNADYAGLRSHERQLSWERARAVCSALRHDVGHLRTKAIGYGRSRPAVIGGTPASRVANRRVDVRVTR